MSSRCATHRRHAIDDTRLSLMTKCLFLDWSAPAEKQQGDGEIQEAGAIFATRLPIIYLFCRRAFVFIVYIYTEESG